MESIILVHEDDGKTPPIIHLIAYTSNHSFLSKRMEKYKMTDKRTDGMQFLIWLTPEHIHFSHKPQAPFHPLYKKSMFRAKHAIIYDYDARERNL